MHNYVIPAEAGIQRGWERGITAVIPAQAGIQRLNTSNHVILNRAQQSEESKRHHREIHRCARNDIGHARIGHHAYTQVGIPYLSPFYKGGIQGGLEHHTPNPR